MYTIEQGTPKNFIIYTKSEHWLFKLIFRGNYQHCYLLKWDGYQWLMLDKKTEYLDISTVELYNGIPLTTHQELLDCLVDDSYVTYIQEVDLDIVRGVYADTTSNFIVSILRPNTCVEYVKSHLGINTIYILTPKGLKESLD